MSVIYQSEKWIEAEASELTDEYMISVFLNDLYQVIYVCNPGGVKRNYNNRRFPQAFFGGETSY